jgi:hypothetical protein
MFPLGEKTSFHILALPQSYGLLEAVFSRSESVMSTEDKVVPHLQHRGWSQSQADSILATDH